MSVLFLNVTNCFNFSGYTPYGAPLDYASLVRTFCAPTQSHLVKMNISERSSKAEIIDASCEVIDSQAHQIGELQERQLVLWALVGVLAVLLAMGA